MKRESTKTMRSGARAIVIGLSLASLSLGIPAFAGSDDDDDGAGDLQPGACSATAVAAFNACANAVRDDFWITIGNCLNVSDPQEAELCKTEARAEKRDGLAECGEQSRARQELCTALGEDRYDPDFDPSGFTTSFSNLNPYLPLAVGNRWMYQGGDETVNVEVLNKTKSIEGVTCVVVNDVVGENGAVVEDTDDWFAQATNGDVYYCGELSKNFEFFDGDNPAEAELIDIDGSFKAGRDGDKPGIVMFAAPPVGTVYRQEFSLGNAEDAAEVLSANYRYGADAELDRFVPAALANRYCDGNCVVTRDFSPLEPDVSERKYYAPGVGLFLEVDEESGDTVELVGCNVDARCPALPAI